MLPFLPFLLLLHLPLLQAEPFRILQLTDIHLSLRHRLHAAHTERTFEELAQLQRTGSYDMVVLTGDIVHEYHSDGDTRSLMRRLAGLLAPAPWTLVFGNHDVYPTRDVVLEVARASAGFFEAPSRAVRGTGVTLHFDAYDGVVQWSPTNGTDVVFTHVPPAAFGAPGAWWRRGGMCERPTTLRPDPALAALSHQVANAGIPLEPHELRPKIDLRNHRL